MERSPLPEDERARLAALRRYEILDTAVDKDFDGVVELAAQICDTTFAFINFIDEDRLWSKARKGTEAKEASRELSFCTHAIRGNDIMIVSDALQDERFSNNPYISSNPGIRFYAGMPLLVDSGHRLGTLCVLDQKPKTLNEKQIKDLQILARQVINLLDLRLANRQLQNLIQSKTRELANFFDRIGDAFISLDKNWNYVFANKQLGEMVHRDPGQLIGKNVWQEFPDAVNSATYHAFHRAMKEQRYICHTDYFEPLMLWQENHIYPSPEGLSVFIRDISDRKHAEMRLIRSIETLERAEEQAKMGSWKLDLLTGKRYWSKQLFLMFGLDPNGEIPSRDILLERIHPEDRDTLLASIEKMKKRQDPGKPVIRTNPSVLPLAYIIGYTRDVRDEKGDIAGYEGTMIDITELQKTNHELDQFVYSISHDLRSPLATILGLLNIAEMEQPGADTVTHLRSIRQQVTRLDNFIKEILDYSMNARTDIQNQRIDFTETIEGVRKGAWQLAHAERVRMNLEVSGSHEFFSDRNRVGIIFNSLYSNSVKYQDVNKKYCSINIKVDIDIDHARIIYADNGIGIESIHMDKIFEMFYRATENAKGPGLGLYIVKEAVYKLGGRIRAESEFGHGTSFEIILPNDEYTLSQSISSGNLISSE